MFGGVMLEAVQIRVRGTVQGVGFRPFVYRLAQQHRLSGWVCNDAGGVDIVAQGTPVAVRAFAECLKGNPPPLAQVDAVELHQVDPDAALAGFEIRASGTGGNPLVDLARDTTVCAHCLAEMRDPKNRRYRHAFINCTDCGPRYTIIQQMPYDRPATTMHGFEMCPACRREYADPADRRFHAQPICCPHCGPQLSMGSASDPLAAAVTALQAGRIVAIKGVGGFHLGCRADREDTVQRLRRGKGRETRPFALMARNIASARRFAVISEREQALLESRERPIVILQARDDNRCAPAVAPGVNTLGIMLPCTPLHELLFADGGFDVLVMTSGNRSGIPLCKDNAQAASELAEIADDLLCHNRPIEMRLDDSIVRLLGDEPVLLRRARGYVPSPLPVPFNVDGLVALGGIMKSTVCVGRGETAYVSQYLGTLANTETVEHAAEVLAHLKQVLGVNPQQVIMDLHPGGLQHYLLPAAERGEVLRVQHHHAHAAACMAENQLSGPVLCVVYDGLGLGEDGTLWGGEILLSEYASSRRLGHLELLDLPGGDAATEFPGRIAYAALRGRVDAQQLTAAFDWLPQRDRLDALSGQPRTSSMGRLFDALSALLGVCRRQSYEGQAAIELEAVADPSIEEAYPIALPDWVMPGKALLQVAFEDLLSGTDRAVIAARFHWTIAVWTAELAARSGQLRVCLCGGCFQNALLVAATRAELQRRGLQPVVHRLLSPGDESISYGQLVTAAARRSLEQKKEYRACA
jgi:hydrogenase maturation protein HypF